MEINPNAYFTLEITELKELDWDKIKQIDIMTQHRFQICSPFLEHLVTAKENNIKFFYSNFIFDNYMFNALINFGVSSIRVSGQLAHELDYLKQFPEVEMRIAPNIAKTFLDYRPEIGAWFRPEDLENLNIFSVCEFMQVSARTESALYRIYAEDKKWDGEVYILIKDFINQRPVNRMIPPEFQERRSNCGMKCQRGGTCRFCDTVLRLADPDFIKPLIEDNNG